MDNSGTSKYSNPSGSLTTKAAFAVLATAMVLLYIGGVASQQLQPGNSLLLQMQEAMFEIDEAMMAYSDLRTSEIGYVLDGEERSLPQISESANQLYKHLDRAAELTTQATEKDQIQALRISIADRLTLNKEIIETRKRNGYKAAAALLDAPTFSKLSRHIETQLTDLRSREKQTRFDASEAIGNGNMQTLGAIWVMMTAAFLILLSMLFILNRYVVETWKAEQKLAEREARMRAIVDTAPDGIVTFSDQGEIESANDAMQKMFAYGPGELIGSQVVAIMENLHLEGHKPDEISAFGEKQIVGIGEEIRGRRKDGSTFPVEAALSVLNLGDRRIFTGIVRDITARKEAEKRVSEFYSTVSHELRTPLTSIRTALGLMTSGAVGELTQKGGHLVRIAGGECDRLIRLINDILDFRKIEAGKLMLKPQLTNPQSLVDTTFQAIRGLADEAGVKLSKSIEFNEALHCDPDRIVQVLTNLISNAIKFSEKGREVSIRVTETDSGKLRFAVIDQGPGIKEDQRSKLFAKFQQLDSSDTRKKGGTGLGLAISKAIIVQHGGQIGVETEVGKGSVFWFELSQGEAIPSGPDETLTLHRLRVMLVADDERLTEPLKDNLLKSGFDLLRAATLAQAERIIEKTFPDIVLVDVELADGSGLEIVKHAGGALTANRVPVIVLGGWNDESGTIANPVLIDLQKNPFDCQRLRQLAKQAGILAAESRILVIEGDAAKSNLLKKTISQGGFMVLDEINESISSMISELEPDVIVLDLSVANEKCFEVLAGLRQGDDYSMPLVIYAEEGIVNADIDKLTLGLTRHLQGTGVSTEEFCESVNHLVQGIVMTTAEGKNLHATSR